MTLPPRRALVAAALVALGVGTGGCTTRAPAPSLETFTIADGPFEIVAQGRRIGAGGFPNNGGNPFATDAPRRPPGSLRRERRRCGRSVTDERS